MGEPTELHESQQGGGRKDGPGTHGAASGSQSTSLELNPADTAFLSEPEKCRFVVPVNLPQTILCFKTAGTEAPRHKDKRRQMEKTRSVVN